MTAPTPQQMRALADKNDAEAEAWRGFSKTSGRIALHEESAAALRTAAEQLEASVSLDGIRRAVKNWWLEGTSNEDELIGRIFTTDTAPQEGRDD